MSIKVMNIVFDRYPNGGGEMLLALAMADHAHDDGTHIYPSVEHLAKKTRQSVRSVQYQIKAMIDAGWLELTNDGTGGRGNYREYRISPAWIKGAEFASLKTVQSECPKGAICDDKGCNLRHPYITVVNHPVNRQAAKGSRLPADWVLPKSWGAWTLKEFPHWTDAYVRTVATLFRNHWTEKTGRDATKLTWEGTWQNWCIKEEQIHPFKNPDMPQAQAAGEWWKSASGIEAKAKELGIVQEVDEIFPYFRIRVFKCAGEGPWTAFLPSGPREEGFRSAGKIMGGKKNGKD